MYALLERKLIYFAISLVFGKGIYKCKWSKQNEFIYSMRPVLERKNSDEGRVNRKILVIAILAAGEVTSHTAWWYQQEKSRLKYGFLWSYTSSKTPLEKKNDILSAASQPSQTMGHTVVIVSKNYKQVAIRSRPLLFAHGSHCPKKTPTTNYPKV